MKVNLKVKEDNKVETIQHEVEKIKIGQFTESMKIVSDILKKAENDPALQELLVELFNQNEDENAEDDGGVVAQKLVGAFETLLVSIPNKAMELLACMAGIEIETMYQQELDDGFDIYDAVIQVNDIDALVKRAKKSFALTKSHTKVMNLFPKKEQTEQKQPSQKPLASNLAAN